MHFYEGLGTILCSVINCVYYAGKGSLTQLNRMSVMC